MYLVVGYASIRLGIRSDEGYNPPMSTETIAATVPKEREGQRLDQALELLMADAGMRERRRAWDTGTVLVDGRPRPKGYRVQAGQRIELQQHEGAVGREEGVFPSIPDGVRVVAQSSGYMAALFKPGGVHSEAIAGKPGASVSACLEAFWPGRDAVLVNRLDYLTSGLLAVAFSNAAAREYRSLEDAGAVSKVYAALVHGRVGEPICCNQFIDAAKRKKVVVSAEPDESGIRTTEAFPLLYDNERRATLLRCVIRKGARHQIRAHLAFAGHPVVGDPVYGRGGGERLYLHHLRLTLPRFEARVVPEWPEWGEWGLGKDDFPAAIPLSEI